MQSGPIIARWDGTAFVPFRRHDNECAERFVIGADYYLDPEEPRSMASHNHQFAWLGEAWKNLPESLVQMYPTPEHLRKRALIEAGFFRETMVDAGSNATALRVASFARADDEFAYVIVEGRHVIKRVAVSQRAGVMGSKKFQESKQKMMDIVSDMIGVDCNTLDRNAGQAA